MTALLASHEYRKGRAFAAPPKALVKRRLWGCLAAVALLAPLSALATPINFTGYYTANPTPNPIGNVGNWTKTVSGDPLAFGHIDHPLDGLSITINGPSLNPASFSSTYVDFTIPADITGVLSFHWSYTSNSPTMTVSDDIAGYIKGGTTAQPTRTQLADNNDLSYYLDPNDDVVVVPATGDLKVNVAAGQLIGFYVYSHFADQFPGVLTITNFDVAPGHVPEPSTLSLLALGAFGIATRRRRSIAQQG